MEDSKARSKSKEKKPPDKKKSSKKKAPKKKERKRIAKVLIKTKKSVKDLGEEKVVLRKAVNFFRKTKKEDSEEVTIKNSRENMKKFLELEDKIKEWKNDPKKAQEEKKDINKAAKNILTDEEFNSLEDLKKEWGLTNKYTAAIVLIDIRINEIKATLNKESLKKEDLKMSQKEFDAAIKIFEEEINKKLEEEEEKSDSGDGDFIEDPEVEKHKKEIQEFEEFWGKPLEEIEKDFKDAGVDFDGKMDIDNMEEKDDFDKFLDDGEAIVKSMKFMDNVDEEEAVKEIMPEVKEEIKKIAKGEIELKAKKENKIANLKDLLDLKKSIAQKAFDERKKLDGYNLTINNFEKLTNKELLSLINDHQNVDLENTVSKIIDRVKQKKELSDTELLLTLSVNLLLREVVSVKNLTNQLMELMEVKEREKKEEKKFVKRPGIIKKIETGNYLSDEEMKKLNQVNKALRNLRDFVQMPKWTEWKKFSEESKKTFLKERTKWNIKRLTFLINASKGINDDSFPKIQDYEIPKALHCQMYYINKFDSGFQIKQDEWDKLYKKGIEENVRKQITKLRLEAKVILEKLEKEGKISGLIKFKGQWIETRGKLFWNMDLNQICKKKLDDLRKTQPWRFPGPPRFPMEGRRGKKFLGKKKKAERDEDFI